MSNPYGVPADSEAVIMQHLASLEKRMPEMRASHKINSLMLFQSYMWYEGNYVERRLKEDLDRDIAAEFARMGRTRTGGRE